MVLASCMQVQNIIGLWNLTAAPPVDDRVRSCRRSCMHTCTCMRQGNNVFSDCNEKLERPSEAGTTMLTVWSSSRGLNKDESWMTIHGHLVLLFLAPTDWKSSTKHRMAGWLVHVLSCRWKVAAPSWRCGPFLEARRNGNVWGGSAPLVWRLTVASPAAPLLHQLQR